MDLIAEAIKNNPWWIGKEIEKVKGLKKGFDTRDSKVFGQSANYSDGWAEKGWKNNTNAPYY